MQTLKKLASCMIVAGIVPVAGSLTGCTAAAELTGQNTSTLNAEAAKGYNQMLGEARSKGELDTTSTTARRVYAVFNRMKPYANQANKTGVPFNWEMNVFKDDELNAFAMPGGKMVVYTGIVDRLKLTDDELAAIVGHEMTHALLEHSKKDAGQKVLTGLAMNVGGALLMSKAGVSADTAGLATEVVGNFGIDKPFSRSQETQADAGGVRLMAQAGYNPQSAVSVWQKMSQSEGDSSKIATLASTHPNHAQRIVAIQKLLPEVMPTYLAAKQRIVPATTTVTTVTPLAPKATVVQKPKPKKTTRKG